MLNIIYFSNVSENTHRFVTRLIKEAAMQNITITADRLPIKGETITTNQDYILISPSYGTEKTGHVPPQIKTFLKNPNNRQYCVGVIGTGNINFGNEFAYAADALAHKLNIPLLHKFELSGFNKDIQQVQRLTQLNRATINQIVENHRKVTTA
jgi:protein involved in ribonucleotide reduction